MVRLVEQPACLQRIWADIASGFRVLLSLREREKHHAERDEYGSYSGPYPKAPTATHRPESRIVENETALPFSTRVGYSLDVLSRVWRGQSDRLVATVARSNPFMDDSRFRTIAVDGACGGQPARLLPPVDVDIGVVYTHERQFMPRLLSSLALSGEGLRLRLNLVHNASSDGAEQWRQHFPDTVVIRNPRRLHYAANLNRVLAVATSPYVLLLNTDMYFDPDEQCVAKMVRFMESHPDCGIAGCRLHRADGSHSPSARRFQTPKVIFASRLALRRLFRRTLDSYFCAEHAATDSWACDWIPGCFLMVRRRAFEEVGYVDAQFIKYFEDVDICLRMGLAGWRVLYYGGTCCYHVEQRSSAGFFSADARVHLRSYLRWIRKWGVAPRIPATRPAAGCRAA